ncbi:MAG: zinc-binding dehydrogenase [Deltaproteobacteria bacterium]|nr:zinc-binding dehydrogenase [Deltaproteobacteria bacterium]
MKAWVIYEHGGVEKLLFEDVPSPVPKPTEVLVEIKACALNHLDIWVRKGLPIKITYPHILGCDIAGIVKEVGGEVKNVKKGSKVLISPGLPCYECEKCREGKDNECPHYGIVGETISGGYAELISVSEKNILPFPKNYSFTEAAAIPLTFVTAWHMLVAKGKIKKGDWVLVLAAGSGVGSAAIQIAKLFHAHVIATASTEEKLDLAKSLGADFVINYREEDFSKKVKELTHKRGVDIVFEHTGSTTWEKSIKSVCNNGVIVTCGATTGYEAVTDLRHVFFRQLSILGSTMGTYSELKEILKYVDQGKLKPVVDKVFPFAQVKQAHQYMENRKQFGKIVLEM